MFSLGQPLPAIMPIAQGTLGFLQARHGIGGQFVQFRIRLGRITHALDQQTQTVAIMAGILEGFTEGFPLLGQTLLDARAQAFEQFLMLGGANKAWEGIQNLQQVRQLRTLRYLAIRVGL